MTGEPSGDVLSTESMALALWRNYSCEHDHERDLR